LLPTACWFIGAFTVLVRANATALSVSKFLAARDRGFTALWCYAKITPAALHCGKFIHRRRGYAEAAGYNPEFEVSDFVHAGDGSARPFAKALR
jgi:hypothetical protein